MARIQAKLAIHIVVLGFGVSGAEAVRELIARGTDPWCIVVIDSNRGRINAAEAVGCNVLEGDASSDETLVDVRTEERSVGQEGVRTGRSRCQPNQLKKKQKRKPNILI